MILFIGCESFYNWRALCACVCVLRIIPHHHGGGVGGVGAGGGQLSLITGPLPSSLDLLPSFSDNSQSPLVEPGSLNLLQVRVCAGRCVCRCVGRMMMPLRLCVGKSTKIFFFQCSSENVSKFHKCRIYLLVCAF